MGKKKSARESAADEIHASKLKLENVTLTDLKRLFSDEMAEKIWDVQKTAKHKSVGALVRDLAAARIHGFTDPRHSAKEKLLHRAFEPRVVQPAANADNGRFDVD